MSDNPFVRNLLTESRKRLVGSLMSYVEQNVYPSLNPKQRDELRQKVLTSVGAYHDACLDIVKASVNDGVISNEYLLQAIYDMHDEIRGL
jgi:hypothetical protein